MDIEENLSAYDLFQLKRYGNILSSFDDAEDVNEEKSFPGVEAIIYAELNPQELYNSE